MRRGASSPSPDRARARKRQRITAERLAPDSDDDIIIPAPRGAIQGPSNVPTGQDPFGSAAKKKKQRAMGKPSGGAPASASAPGPSSAFISVIGLKL